MEGNVDPFDLTIPKHLRRTVDGAKPPRRDPNEEAKREAKEVRAAGRTIARLHKKFYGKPPRIRKSKDQMMILKRSGFEARDMRKIDSEEAERIRRHRITPKDWRAQRKQALKERRRAERASIGSLDEQAQP